MSGKSKSAGNTAKTLKAVWLDSPPSRFLDYKDFLRSLHAAVEEKHGRYSFHQFAKDLGLSSNNAAYVIVHGLRKINDEQAETIIETLGLSKAERRYFLQLISFSDCHDESRRRELFQKLVDLKEGRLASERDRLLLRFFKDWHHATIFEMVGLEDFSSDPHWLASRFFKRLTYEQINRSLDLLTQLGLIRFDAELNRHVKLQQTLSMGDEVRGLAAVGYHLQMLELSQASMWQVPEDEREIGATTLAVNEDLAKRLKEDMRLFRHYAVFLSEQCAKPDRIIQLNVQLFAMTRGQEG